jgi:hypothetical protein
MAEAAWYDCVLDALPIRVWSVGRLLLLAAALWRHVPAVFRRGAARRAARARSAGAALVGKTVSDATQSLGALGLTLRIDPTREPMRRSLANRIMQQDPPAGAPRAVAAIDPRVAQRGPRTTTVPELIGQTEGPRACVCSRTASSSAPSPSSVARLPCRRVVSQDPPPAAKAPTVSLLHNRGEEATTYVMPDVIGMDGNRVSDALRERGFRVTITGSQPYPGVPPGHRGAGNNRREVFAWPLRMRFRSR